MSEKSETRIDQDELEQHIGIEQNMDEQNEDAAVLSAAVVSAGVATFAATWVSGVLSSGLPRVGYFIGAVIVMWFVGTFLLSKAFLELDRWFDVW